MDNTAQQFASPRSIPTVVVVMLGFAFGWISKSLLPTEVALAETANSGEKFAMVTTGVDITNTVESVFILDFLTGDLKGAVINPRTGIFTNFYQRNVAADFQLQAAGKYSMVTGRTVVNAGRGVTPATGIIYIGELTTGKVIAYQYPYNQANVPTPPVPLAPRDQFEFRAAAN